MGARAVHSRAPAKRAADDQVERPHHAVPWARAVETVRPGSLGSEAPQDRVGEGGVGLVGSSVCRRRRLRLGWL